MITTKLFIKILKEKKKVLRRFIKLRAPELNKELLDDVLQTTLLKAYCICNSKSFKTEGEIYNTLKNVAYEETRKSIKLDKDISFYTIDPCVECHIQDVDLIKNILNVLPLDLRELALMIYDGYTIDDAAEELNITKGSVYRKLQYIKQVINENKELTEGVNDFFGRN